MSQYQVVTFGCQMNEHDSEILSGMLESLGYKHTEKLEQCDAIIINTCCVRESAENRILGYIGNLKKFKKSNPHLIIAVGGCMVQQPEAVKKIRKTASHVDIIFGTHNFHRLPELITEVLNGGQPQVAVEENQGQIYEDLPVKRRGKIKAQVAIMYGCNNFCTYCIVPYVRGRERSRLPEAIQKEIEALSNQGLKEIMLLGQNVNSYGMDFDTSFDFADLLKLIDGIQGIKRVRYLTSHPRDFNRKLIDTISQCKTVCEHFHLPIQAGSNRILNIMNRGYTRENYLSLINEIRNKFNYCSITTDIIVGFPGETDADFKETLELVQEAKFDAAYTFLYSSRSGTPAAKMPDQISLQLKKERLQELMEIQNLISLEINQKLEGTTEEILVEGPSKTNEKIMFGRTRTNKIVNFPGDQRMVGKITHVRIKTAKTWHLEGEKQEEGYGYFPKDPRIS